MLEKGPRPRLSLGGIQAVEQGGWEWINGNELSPEMLSQITDYAVRVVGVLFLLFVARIIAGWVARVVVAGLERANFDRTLTKFFGNLARYPGDGRLGLFGCFRGNDKFCRRGRSGQLAIGLAFRAHCRTSLPA
ncbi:MAG: hypothetical protein R2748_19915 [Bryobacterales bacterium]